MRNNLYLKITIGFFVFMIVMSIFSRISYDLIKAKVKVVTPERGYIEHDFEKEARVETIDYAIEYVPDNLVIKSIAVSEGENVTEGDLLFSVDVDELSKKIKEIEEIIYLSNQKNDILIKRASDNYNNCVNDAEDAKQEALQKLLETEQAYKEYEQSLTDDEKKTNQTLLELENAYQSQLQNYDAVVQEQDSSVEGAKQDLLYTQEENSLESERLEKENGLQDLKTILEQEGNFYASANGCIKDILINVGEKTTGEIAILISDFNSEEKIEIKVSEDELNIIENAEDIKILGKGMDGEEKEYLTNEYSVGINVESESDNYEYVMVVKIPAGFFMPGSKVIMNTKQMGVEYANRIPVQAIRQKSHNKYYLYVIQEEKGVFGQELVAKQITVTIIDKNDNYIAVEESLTDEVIVSSNKELNEGSRIKIDE